MDHANVRRAKQDVAVGYNKTMPSENSLPCNSYVPGTVTMERGSAFDDHGSGPFPKYRTRGQAMGIGTHFDGFGAIVVPAVRQCASRASVLDHK